ncbi:hypothetical protein [Streptomyces griseofuscus]|uniref:hypothetical protein n=1 Tax=Streptomyces griseofuscus TaxID=146922 RepID=UPI003400D69B
MTLSTELLHVHARYAVDPQAAKLEIWEVVVTATQICSVMFGVAGVGSSPSGWP